MITSGFRTAAGQAAQQNSPYGSVQVSWHQAGEAIDLNSKVAVSILQAIETAMTDGYDSQRRPSRRLCARAPVTWMMRLIIISTTLLLGLAFAQRGADLNTGTKVYFLNDDSHKQWCGYASESRLKTQIQTLRAMIVGEADYKNDRVYAIHITEVDETGDWAVNDEYTDEYTLDESETIRSLKRTINIIPEDNSEEQLFLIKNGKVIKQSSTVSYARVSRLRVQLIGLRLRP